MGTYYIKGGSKYNEVNPKVWVTLFLGGFDDSKYTDVNWKDIDYDFGGAGSVVTVQDPFWRMGSSSGGAKELELGLWNDYRIKFETTGITYWDGDSWEDLLAEGGANQLSDLSDVSSVVYTASYVLRANGSGYVSAQLAHGDLSTITSDQHHAQSHDNTYHTTNYKPDFSENSAFNKNFGTGSTEVCVGNDSRLSDNRTPTQHALDNATYHTINANTTFNATTTKHGFLKQLDNNASNFMNGQGNWASIPGGFIPAIGFIAMFSGVWEDNVTMPGWYACIAANSGHGVPDLERKFIRGAATSGGSGGSDDAVVVQHNHSGSAQNAGNHTHGIWKIATGSYREVITGVSYGNNQTQVGWNTASAGEHGHTLTINNTGVSGVGANVPVFYELVFIMRVS